MKKYLIITIIICCTGFLHALIQANLGFDLGGSIEMAYDGGGSYTPNVNLGITTGIEYLMQKDKFLYGAGLEFQIPRGINDTDADKKATFSFLPIYLAGKYQFPDIQYKPEIGLEFGYNLFMGSSQFKNDKELNGGLYFGIGAAANYNNFIFQIKFKSNKGSGDWKDSDSNDSGTDDYSYNHLTFMVGYRFGK